MIVINAQVNELFLHLIDNLPASSIVLLLKVLGCIDIISGGWKQEVRLSVIADVSGLSDLIQSRLSLLLLTLAWAGSLVLGLILVLPATTMVDLSR